MESKCIEEEIKKDKLNDFRTKLKIVRYIIDKLDDEFTKGDMKQSDGKKIKSETTDKRVQVMCHIPMYFIYLARKFVGIQNRNLSLECWLDELSLQEERPYDTFVKVVELREPFIEAYLSQHIVPLENKFKYYIDLKANLQDISTISCLKLNSYTLCRLPKTKKRILIEKSQRLHERMLYLKKITQYRVDGRKIIYLEERIVHTRNITTSNYEFRNACTHCVLLLNEEGIMLNYNLVSRLYHELAKKFLVDFIKDNLDRLPPHCVVVLGDRGHHKQNALPLPTKFSSKKQMTDWLEYNKIEHNADWHRAELYKLIEAHKRSCNFEYYVDDFIKSHGHDVVRCPFHCQSLSHFKDFWKEVQDLVLQKGKKLLLAYVIKESIKEADEKFTPNIWKEKEKIMIEDEHRFLKEDLQVEEIVDRLCTMTKYSAADRNHSSITDLEYPLLEIDYNFSKLVASSLDETESYLIK